MIARSKDELKLLLKHAKRERTKLRPYWLARNELEEREIEEADNLITGLEWEMQWTNAKCFECGGKIHSNETPFFWRGAERELTMHLKCLVAMSKGLLKDMEAALERM